MKDTSLEQVVSQTGPLPPQHVAAIGLRLLEEMTAGRADQVRPDMVMLGQDGQVSLSSGTRPGPMPGFLPPEGIMGPQSGLWMLGATLFTAVEGYPPAPGVTPRQAGPLAPVLERLLADNPVDRPDLATLRAQLKEVAGPYAASTVPTMRVVVRGEQGILVPRAIVVLAAALAVAMAAAIGVLAAPLFRDSPTSAAAASPSPSGQAKGRFATVPRACSLLDEALVAELVPSARTSEVDTGECNWLTADWRTTQSIRYDMRLRLTVYKPDGTELIKARNHFKGQKDDLSDDTLPATPTPAPPRDLSGIGDEAFMATKRSSINIFGGSVTRIIVFRVSNLVGELRYEGGGAKDDADGLLARGAEKATRAVVKALDSHE